MSIINQMLQDLEERKENAVKGQDGIISRPSAGATTARTPIILLSLLSLSLIATVVYLLWDSDKYLLTQQPAVAPVAKTPKLDETNTIASLLKESGDGVQNIASTPVATKSSPQKPAQIIRVTPPAQPEIVATPQVQEQPAPPQLPPVAQSLNDVAEIQQPAQATVSIKNLIPPNLQGSWRAQPLTIQGKNFHPNSQVLVCWPAKCVTLKDYRVSYLSSNELAITLTTGVKNERWHLTVINPDGGASNAKEFMVSSAISAIKPESASVPAPTVLQSEDEPDDDSSSEFTSVSKQVIPLTAYQQAEEYFLNGNRLEQDKKIAQAITLWEKSVLLAPEHHSSRQKLIASLINSARIVEAEGYIKQAIKLFPNYPAYIQNLAQIHLLRDDSQTAIELLNVSMERGVVNAELYAFAAALYQREKNHQKSIEHYQRALSLKAGNGVWWMGLGISFEQSGKYREALSAFEQAKIAVHSPANSCVMFQSRSQKTVVTLRPANNLHRIKQATFSKRENLLITNNQVIQ